MEAYQFYATPKNGLIQIPDEYMKNIKDTVKVRNSTGMKLMSGAKVFIDTNVLIYFYSKDEPEKQKAAHEILNRHFCIVSTQVLNEVCNVWFNKC